MTGKNAMRFSAEWSENAPNVSAEERATLCDLVIQVGNDNVSAHRDIIEGAVFDAITVPTVHLAEGIATDWWSIFGGRDRPHALRRYRRGFVLPDLRITCHGQTFEISGEQKHFVNPGIRFWQPDTEVIPRHEAEEAFSGFIEGTIARLVGAGIEESDVQLQWAQVEESRQNPEEAAFCEAAGALGVNPYSIADVDAEFILNAGNLFSRTSLIDFLSGVATVEGSYRRSTLNKIHEADRQMEEHSRLPELRNASMTIPDDIRQIRPGEGAWGPGYRAARLLRDVLGIPAADTFGCFSDIARQVGTDRFNYSDDLPLVHAVVSRYEDVFVHLRRPRHAGSEFDMFNFARAIGDAVCFPNDGCSVVNGLHGAERQAMGRAFAAEFLAPVESVISAAAEGLDVEEVAGSFAVFPEVIKRQLENHDRIELACS